MKLGEAIYKSSQQEAEAEAEPATEEKKDDVVDAEFEEVDKK